MMQKLIIILFTQCLSASLAGQFSTSKQIIYSRNVKDSFEIYVSNEINYNPTKKYEVVYYCDASLNSGKELRRQIENDVELSKKSNIIFVGIGHIGNFHELRRRDFIQPSIKKGDTVAAGPLFGHCREFYTFLTKELIPQIEVKYSCSADKTIMGHSLGGLFAMYCFFQDESIFKNFVVLSPALWINNYSIYAFNKIGKALNQKSYLYFSAGSQETLNYILSGTNRLNSFLKNINYLNLEFEYKIHASSNHNSQVPKSINYILSRLKKL